MLIYCCPNINNFRQSSSFMVYNKNYDFILTKAISKKKKKNERKCSFHNKKYKHLLMIHLFAYLVQRRRFFLQFHILSNMIHKMSPLSHYWSEFLRLMNNMNLQK